MDRPNSNWQIIAAFAIALGAVGLLLATGRDGPTPLLTEPRPDLDLPLIAIGAAAGLWAAIRITRLPAVAHRRFGRIALWIILPLWLSVGLVTAADRLYEAISFRHGGTWREVTLLLLETDRSTSRRGGKSYRATFMSPAEERRVTIPIDEATFDRITPLRECLTILIERAPNGAVRLIRPVRWKVRCPWVGQPA